MVRPWGVLLLCAFAAVSLMQPEPAAAALPPVGHVVYLRGDPSGMRAGRPLWLGVGLGLPVRPFDYFSTNDNELLEIETTEAAGVLATIRLQPNSAVYLDLVPGGAGRMHEIRLLAGSVSVILRDADPVSQLAVVAPPVRVDGAGAAYDVTLAPTGDVLVTVGRGVARVRDDAPQIAMRDTTSNDGPPNDATPNGRVRTLFADPARAVEYGRDDTMRTVPMIVRRADRLRSVWRGQVEPRTVEDAQRVYQHLDARVMELRPLFENAYRVLMSRRDILDGWMETDRQERNPLQRPEVTAAEMREVGREVEGAYRLLRALEAAWYRLAALAPGPLPGPSDNGEPRDAIARVLEEQMHMVRYCVRLYLERSVALERAAQ